MAVVQVEGRSYALFTHLAGYYELLDEELRMKVAAALAEGREVTFIHDKRLTILGICTS